MEKFYLQNKDAGYLGNAPVWWAKGGGGYTAYILGAERFTRDQAEKYVKEDKKKWAMYNCAYVDSRLHLVFDSQDFRNLGTDAPCGWKSGYAQPPSAKEKLIVLRKARASLHAAHQKIGGQLGILLEIDDLIAKYGMDSA